ncbi:MAG: phosphotransferase family protein [bacterium]|nr:phosphotransferase family protein [bacterium]
MTGLDEVRGALTPWFGAKLGGDVSIADLKRHAEGWSWQTYTMTVVADGVEHGFAVRREPESGLLEPYDIEGQYRLHRAVVDHSDVPMPGLRWLEMSPDVLGMPFFVMDRVEGAVPVQWAGDDPEIFPDEATRAAMGHHFIEVLAAIHNIDPAATGLSAPATTDEAALTRIAHWESVYEESFLVEVPLTRWLIGWLRNNIATSGRLGLVHGDYRIGNFMVNGSRIVAVFDWELAHIGDPIFDVAWGAMPLFRGRTQLASQLLEVDDYLDRYAKASGHTIDPEVYHFWLMYGHLRAVVPQIRAARVFEDGAPDLRLGAMGHQYLYVLKQLSRELGWR